MFGFGKSKSSTSTQPEPNASKTLFGRLKAGLTKLRHNLIDGLTNLVHGRKTIDADLLEELETLLITADVGYRNSMRNFRGY